MTTPLLDFTPAWWLPGPHAQTLGARFLRPKGGIEVRRERWETPDGDFLDLDFVLGDHLRDDVLVLLLHGLEGSSASGYIFELGRRLSDQGIGAVALNFRSCSGELNRGRRLYHSGETSDPAWVIGRLHERRPGLRLAAAGVSLGGNVLLKLLGESPEASGLYAAAAWSVPFDLAAGSRFMERGFARNYVARLLRSLKAKVRARQAELGPHIDFERSLRATTFWEFDDAATAPLHGFDGADDYYRRSSSAGFIPAISTPTLILHSRDDPFLPAEAIPTDVMRDNPSVSPVITDHGGHVGHVSGGMPLGPHFWAERVIAEFLAARLSLSVER
ncbi:MAG: alpha/beta fold hydrolase [Thermoanaerobaculales bacterium]|jgi:predicted alpha/beta-fold hydrolase|nr:alpha/beta fold hydrolase [Thermoanaerobaculales bacterium]